MVPERLAGATLVSVVAPVTLQGQQWWHRACSPLLRASQHPEHPEHPQTPPCMVGPLPPELSTPVLLGLWGLFPEVCFLLQRYSRWLWGMQTCPCFFLCPCLPFICSVMNCQGELPKSVCFGLDQLFFSL